jgi:trk system potassium uptake protein TrkA
MATMVMIIGGGKVGSYLASLLMSQGYRVKVIEQDREELARLKRDLPPEVLVLGNGTDPNVLESCGIRQANVVAAVTGQDETNLVVASLARSEFGVPRIIGRVNNPRNAWLFTPEMGIDVAVNQANLMAHLIAEEMSLGDMMTLLKLRKGQFSLVEEKIDPTALVVGRRVRDVQLPEDCQLVAIIRQGQLVVPRGDTVLQGTDEVLAIVHASQVAQLAAILGPQAA